MRSRFLVLTSIFLTMFSFSRAEPLTVGSAAPLISATTETGATLNFAEVYPKGFTLVYFYPKADTPGCTAQGCSLRDAYAELAKKGVTVIGVSTDSVEAQKKFKEKYNLPFTLIADTDKSVMKAFGQEGVPLVGFAKRQAYLINKEGKIVWLDLTASTKQQSEDVLAAIKELEGAAKS
jgi:peroxiredoxin Q/BCP